MKLRMTEVTELRRRKEKWSGGGERNDRAEERGELEVRRREGSQSYKGARCQRSFAPAL